jgi:hypothetical protein
MPDLPPIASFAHGKAQGLLPGEATHGGFGSTVDFECGEGLALGTGPPPEGLSIPIEADFASKPIEIKVESPGAPQGLDRPADDFEHRRALLRYRDHQVGSRVVCEPRAARMSRSAASELGTNAIGSGVRPSASGRLKFPRGSPSDSTARSTRSSGVHGWFLTGFILPNC